LLKRWREENIHKRENREIYRKIKKRKDSYLSCGGGPS
jgi:hypothetical protein